MKIKKKLNKKINFAFNQSLPLNGSLTSVNMTVRGLNLMFEPGKVLLLSKIEKIYSMQELILSIDLIINKYFFFIIVGMDKICFIAACCLPRYNAL